jgi:hypothetical protein
MTPLHRSEEPKNSWRRVVAWLLCHPEILTKHDLLFCEDLISLVVITYERHIELTRVFSKAMAATGGAYPDALRWHPPNGT